MPEKQAGHWRTWRLFIPLPSPDTVDPKHIRRERKIHSESLGALPLTELSGNRGDKDTLHRLALEPGEQRVMLRPI